MCSGGALRCAAVPQWQRYAHARESSNNRQNAHILAARLLNAHDSRCSRASPLSVCSCATQFWSRASLSRSRAFAWRCALDNTLSLSLSLLSDTLTPTPCASQGLLTAFPKLLSSGTREHTFIDTESVRYVYQPLESFFVLIITNKTSNIVEDLHTIQLLAKLVPDICGSLSDASIREKQFELVFGFDELLTAGGHSENINLQQIRVNMEMESHEEKLHNMILESKRAAAKDDMKRNMTRIKEEQRERARMERAGLGSSSASGFGSQMASSFGSASSSFGRSPRSGDSYASPSVTSPTSFSRPEPERPVVSKAAGMKLGGGGAKTGKSFLDAMAAEDGLKDLPPMSAVVQDVPKPEIAGASFYRCVRVCL